MALICGGVTEDRYWSETWTNTERVLTQLTDWLRGRGRSASSRSTRAGRTIATSASWSAAGRWLDVRALVEEHAAGRALLRVNMYLRPTSVGIVTAVLFSAALLAAASAGLALRWPLAGVIAAVIAIGDHGYAVWLTAQTTAIVQRGVARRRRASRR